MSFNPQQGTREWHYMMENINPDRNLILLRLDEMNKNGLRISLHDHTQDNWTKWETLFNNKHDLRTAYDIHREIIENEIVIESDYLSFQENYEAIRLIGAVMEDKGFKPMYYYSGSKSIHMHIYLDYRSILDLDEQTQHFLHETYTKNKFFKEFISYLRAKAATYWDTRARVSDEQVANSTRHLIRSELSLNKLGFKTFIGYTYKDLTWIPPLHNFKTKGLPRIGSIILSHPNCMQTLVEEFLNSKDIKSKQRKRTSKMKSLNNWLDDSAKDNTDLRPCVKAILNDGETLKGDGANRAFFILFNELKKAYDEDKAKEIVENWNNKLGNPIRQVDIDYNSKTKTYTLTCKYIHDFLSSVGFKTETYEH